MRKLTSATAALTLALFSAASGAADLEQGKHVFQQSCIACHGSGVAGAPEIGDRAAWAPRIAKGMRRLVDNAINGFQGQTGVMPPKGGYPDLSAEQVAAAVAYMVEKAND